MIPPEFSQVEKMAAEPLETRFNLSHLVLEASGGFFSGSWMGLVAGKVPGTCQLGLGPGCAAVPPPSPACPSLCVLNDSLPPLRA